MLSGTGLFMVSFLPMWLTMGARISNDAPAIPRFDRHERFKYPVRIQGNSFFYHPTSENRNQCMGDSGNVNCHLKYDRRSIIRIAEDGISSLQMGNREDYGPKRVG
jgi:hypothetical protein